jgi:hypothetical protein
LRQEEKFLVKWTNLVPLSSEVPFDNYFRSKRKVPGHKSGLVAATHFKACVPLQMRPKGGTERDWIHVLTTSREECEDELALWREQNPEWEFRILREEESVAELSFPVVPAGQDR